MLTAQVAVAPLQAPPQLLKRAPAVGAAVSVTTVPLGKLAEQLEPQLIPAGPPVTVPAAEPRTTTLRVTESPDVVAVASLE
jgi:hypothetical protein